jgi:hypothetical protein
MSSETATKGKEELSVGNGDSCCDEDQPPTKKPRANSDDDGATPLPLPGKQRGKKVPPRSPLPVRINRVLNPGAPDKKNTRHSSAQVAANKQRKEDLRRDLDALAQRQIEILAEMEVEQEMADDKEDRDAIRTLADVETDVDMSEAFSNVGSSEYGGDTEVDGGDTEEEMTPKKEPAKYVVC